MFRDRIKQIGTFTGASTIALTGAADTNMLTFEQGLQGPTVAQAAGTLFWPDVPILVESLDGAVWGTYRGKVTRDGSNNYTVELQALHTSSSWNAVGRSFDAISWDAADKYVSVVPSYAALGQLNIQGTATPTWENGEALGFGSFSNGARRAPDALLALGPLSIAGYITGAAGSTGAIAIGESAKAGVNTFCPGAVAVGSGANANHAYGSVVGGLEVWTARPFHDCTGQGHGLDVNGSVALYQLTGRGVMAKITTNATVGKLGCYDSTGTLLTGSESTYVDVGCYHVKGTLMAYEPATDTKKIWDLEWRVSSDSTYTTTALLGSLTKTVLHDPSTVPWDVAVSTDSGLNSMSVEVTGEAAKTIVWSFIYEDHRHEVW